MANNNQQYNPNSYETTPEEDLEQLRKEIEQVPPGAERTEMLREIKQLEERLF